MALSQENKKIFVINRDEGASNDFLKFRLKLDCQGFSSFSTFDKKQKQKTENKITFCQFVRGQVGLFADLEGSEMLEDGDKFMESIIWIDFINHYGSSAEKCPPQRACKLFYLLPKLKNEPILFAN